VIRGANGIIIVDNRGGGIFPKATKAPKSQSIHHLCCSVVGFNLGSE
jgi:hypothetical protein